MNERFPIHIHRRDENGTRKFLATTALVKLADSPDRLQAQLGELADTYARAVEVARLELDVARRDQGERTRAYWRVGKAIRDFEATLDAAGFYLVSQTDTFARDLALHSGSLRKILAFQKRFPEVDALDSQTAWMRYRERQKK
ncbi:MAG TPA: hypothetical protein VF429_05075 [Anaerolineae bacterium]|jgi:hypothetical protein